MYKKLCVPSYTDPSKRWLKRAYFVWEARNQIVRTSIKLAVVNLKTAQFEYNMTSRSRHSNIMIYIIC